MSILDNLRGNFNQVSPLSHLDPFIDVSDLELNKEGDRLRSFTQNGWCNRYVDCNELALLGFFFYKRPDVVKCYFCRQSLNEFQPNDKVLKEHLKFSPNCPLLIRRQTHNEPIDSDKLDRALPPPSYDEYGTGRRKSRVEEDIAYPRYRITSERMRTFRMWPISMKLKPEELCDAGFFYSGQSDNVICFSCGVEINKWGENDNPWVEHKNLLEKDCSYLKLNSDKLEENQKKFDHEEKLRSTAGETRNVHENCEKEKEIGEESMCKICFSNKSSIVFLPCKHVAVCGQCVYGIDNKCPICRAEIIEKIKLYYA